MYACSGTEDLAVGAAGDSDAASGGSGIERGAVYILFLYPNGTVKGEQKISDEEGALAAALNTQDHFGISVARMSRPNSE